MPLHPSDSMPLVEAKGLKFSHQTVVIDGTRYQNCSFTDCKIIYRGGPTRLASCSISPQCTLELQDAAAFVYQTLGELGWKLTPPPWTW